MPYEVISKPSALTIPVTPNLHDYAAQRASLSWDALAKELNGLPGGGLNLAYEAIDRHVAKRRGDKTAIRWESKTGEQETYSFADLARMSNKWANALKALGVQKGDRVFVFLDRIPELYAAVYGTLKAGAIIGPL